MLSTNPVPVTPEALRRAPKVLLHDHLDGGLRPATVIELADASGYRDLPTSDVDALGRWFTESADSGSLVRYLETFAHTCGVMQSTDALVRVAAECAEDLAADGVVYAEVRYAPELFCENGLSLDTIVEAVQEGFRIGTAMALQAGKRIRICTLLDAMLQNASALEIAGLAERRRDTGLVSSDIAVPEAGFTPTRNLYAFEYLRQQNAHFTIRTGEAFGLRAF